jgi:hypothetical protein
MPPESHEATTRERNVQMSLKAQGIAAEIIKLELLQSQGEVEFGTVTTEEVFKPIKPRLRYLHQELADTGFGPLMGAS